MISLTTADSALKEVYLDVIKNQLNNDLDPFYSKIVKTEQDIAGNEVKKLLAVGITGGIGAGAEDGTLPTVNNTTYLAITTTLKNLYGQLEISDKAIRASENESGAFLNLLNAEMDNLIESSKYHLRRMLYCRGNGMLSKSASTATEGSAVYGVDNPYAFMIGMRVSAKTTDGDAVSYLTDVEIVDIDYANSTITVETGGEYVEDEDEIIVPPFNFFVANMVANGEMIGVGGITNNSLVTQLYGLTRANYPVLLGYRKGVTSANFNYMAVLQFIDDLKVNENSNIDLIATDYKWKAAYQAALKALALNVDIVDLEGGVRALSINGIPVYANRFVDNKTAYGIDSSTFKLHQLCDWAWLTGDKGDILHQKDGYAVHTATLVKYCDLICDRPCKNGAFYIQ